MKQQISWKCKIFFKKSTKKLIISKHVWQLVGKCYPYHKILVMVGKMGKFPSVCLICMRKYPDWTRLDGDSRLRDLINWNSILKSYVPIWFH